MYYIQPSQHVTLLATEFSMAWYKMVYAMPQHQHDRLKNDEYVLLRFQTLNFQVKFKKPYLITIVNSEKRPSALKCLPCLFDCLPFSVAWHSGQRWNSRPSSLKQSVLLPLPLVPVHHTRCMLLASGKHLHSKVNGTLKSWALERIFAHEPEKTPVITWNGNYLMTFLL